LAGLQHATHYLGAWWSAIAKGVDLLYSQCVVPHRARQRLSIATALVHNPRVFFLDEPTTGLDPQARRNLWKLIEQIRDKGVTVMLTTHYMDEAEMLCDRVAIMDRGQIIQLDTPKNLIKQLLAKGFKKEQKVEQANLEDVFIDLTGKALRD